MSKIFRNPARNEKVPMPAYAPEYIRLGVSPVEFGSAQKQFLSPKKMSKKYENGSASFSLEDLPEEEIDPESLPDSPPHIFSHEDLPVPDLPSHIFSHEDLPVEDSHEPSAEKTEVPQFMPGEYAILIQGEICFISSSLEEVELWLEQAIFKQDVDPQDMMVIQRIPIKIGVSLGL